MVLRSRPRTRDCLAAPLEHGLMFALLLQVGMTLNNTPSSTVFFFPLVLCISCPFASIAAGHSSARRRCISISGALVWNTLSVHHAIAVSSVKRLVTP
jgi:hypothetical protein